MSATCLQFKKIRLLFASHERIFLYDKNGTYIVYAMKMIGWTVHPRHVVAFGRAPSTRASLVKGTSFEGSTCVCEDCVELQEERQANLLDPTAEQEA